MCVKSRRSVGCARNDGKVKTENGVQDESDKGMMYYIMPSCFARWHFSCAIERKTASIAQTAPRQRQHAVAYCREPRLFSQLLTAQPLFTLKMRWTKTQTAIPCECLLGEVRLWRKRNIPQSKQRLDITAQSAISSCNARYHHEVISFFRVIARSNECCDVAI